jgi:hypothetical protein
LTKTFSLAHPAKNKKYSIWNIFDFWSVIWMELTESYKMLF